jgi:hypothetical protein
MLSRRRYRLNSNGSVLRTGAMGWMRGSIGYGLRRQATVAASASA